MPLTATLKTIYLYHLLVDIVHGATQEKDADGGGPTGMFMFKEDPTRQGWADEGPAVFYRKIAMVPIRNG